MRPRDLNSDTVFGDNFREESVLTAKIIFMLFLGFLAAFAWNNNSLGLGIGILNTPVARGGVLLAVLALILHVEVLLSE